MYNCALVIFMNTWNLDVWKPTVYIVFSCSASRVVSSCVLFLSVVLSAWTGILWTFFYRCAQTCIVFPAGMEWPSHGRDMCSTSKGTFHNCCSNLLSHQLCIKSSPIVIWYYRPFQFCEYNSLWFEVEYITSILESPFKLPPNYYPHSSR